MFKTLLNQNSQALYDAYCEHSSGRRIHTDTTIQAELRKLYPRFTVTATISDLLSYATAGNATATLASDYPVFSLRAFDPAPRRPRNDEPGGTLKDIMSFALYDYHWQAHDFKLFIIDEQNGPSGGCDKRFYLLGDLGDVKTVDRSKDDAADALIMAAGIWAAQTSDGVWVFDFGHWMKDKELWKVVKTANWDDVILDNGTKDAIMGDVLGFFDAESTYAEFGTPWKRGLIFHGSPGNGKTSTLKALSKALMARPDPIPTLYVKTLVNRGGPQMSVRSIFMKARQTAPCLLLFEDIDSLVTDQVRSYFFNEVDGLENNDGILMIASTNNLDKLDQGLSKRPSRFDRKYRFGNPSFDERVRYCEYWSNKLSQKAGAAMSPGVPQMVSSITQGFSFAYLKEAYVSSLLELARAVPVGDTNLKEVPDQKWGRLGNLLEKQVINLKSEMAEADKSEAEIEKEKEKQ